MLLFPSSIFIILLGIIFIKTPPESRNHIYGFRTKKSMKNQKNWDKAQIIYGKYTKQFFSYSLYFSLMPLALDIFALITKNDNTIFWSFIFQGLILCILLFYINFKVNKELN
ncbi:SdpI family protein [Staphylococcus epidermidis]|uniref:SdpI family protein n=1 Tax=Staphylococcus TaxID=1279 RepID=UPI00026BFF6F|nr:SdpI family protein [Staphylococcus epidermidis]EJE11701.1 hypothetical protein HMPREF9980_12513 [Staphylococcus epidermidis NIHLM031]HDH6894847.1 SdpI family protein [Staphylococcus aureus]KSZ60862.1 hypothetical protein RES3_11865 [Staphylococcus epidermidis]KSZ66563.1 hypothetical protein RES4_11345 [Staphylococcus epidermidis]KSZ67571.1 hypothetical protein RES2_02110 [Staphylococcus epidermidis]